MAHAYFEGTLDSRTDIVVASAAFDRAINFFNKYKGVLLSTRDLAYARESLGPDNPVMFYGSYVREAVLYMPHAGIFLLSHSPLLNPHNAAQAVKAHARKQEYFIAENTIGRPNGEQGSAPTFHFLKQKGDSIVPTNRFSDDELTAFLFSDQAMEYGRFLRSLGVRNFEFNFLPRKYIDSMPKPFIRQVWMRREGHGIDAAMGELHTERLVRGSLDLVKIDHRFARLARPCGGWVRITA